MPKPTPAAKPAEFETPTIGQGWPVLWQHSEGERPCTAFVTAVYPRAVDLMIYPPGSTRSLIKTAVRHRDDPLRKNLIGDNDDGFWSHTTFGEALVGLMDPKVETAPAPSE